MKNRSLRANSRVDWAASGDDRPLTLQEINAGALLRISDAVEKMALRHTEMIDSRDYYKRRADFLASEVDVLYRRIRSLKGQITKLKKRA